MAHLEWKTKSGQMLGLFFDAVSVIEHGLTAEVATHPVENGPDVADHIRPDLPTISLTATVSNSPMRPTAALQSRFGVRAPIGTYRPVPLPRAPVRPPVPAAARIGLSSNPIGDALNAATEPTAADALVFDGLKSRVREVTDILTKIVNDKQLVSLKDEARDYTNMAITGRVIVRTAEGGRACQVQLDMQQIKIVTSAVVDAPIPAEVRGQGGTAGGSAGAKQDPQEEAKKTQMKSLAATLFDAF
jgi:hypothetical protein